MLSTVLRHTDRTKDSRKVFGWIQLLGSRRGRQSDVVVVNQESYGAYAFISSQPQMGFLVSQRLSRTSTHEFIERRPCDSICDSDAPNKQLYKQQSDSQIPILSPTSFAQYLGHESIWTRLLHIGPTHHGYDGNTNPHQNRTSKPCQKWPSPFATRMQDDVLGRNNVQRECDGTISVALTEPSHLQHPAKKVRCKFASKAMELVLVFTPLETIFDNHISKRRIWCLLASLLVNPSPTTIL